MGGPFAQDILIKSNLFVLSPNVKYMVTGGHWDNSFRVQLVEKAKLVARIAHHNGGWWVWSLLWWVWSLLWEWPESLF